MAAKFYVRISSFVELTIDNLSGILNVLYHSFYVIDLSRGPYLSHFLNSCL